MSSNSTSIAGATKKARRAPSRPVSTVDETGRASVFVVLILLIFLMGGSSRGDVVLLVVLRPVAALFAAYAAATISLSELQRVRVPLAFLGSLALLISLQLVALPPSIWMALPERQLIAELSRQIGMENVWRPLAMSPEGARNALFSLLVPLAVLLNFARLTERQRGLVLPLFWLLAMLSVLLGALQLVGQNDGPLYFYQWTNGTLPVGFFANRNHQALFVATGIVTGSVVLVMAQRRELPRFVGAIAAMTFVLFPPFLLAVGSRAGLVIGAAMFVPAAFIAWRGFLQDRYRAAEPSRKKHMTALAVVGVTAVAGLFAYLLTLSRSLAFSRLTTQSINEDLRARVLPTVIDMVESQFPVGAGFGGFDSSYRQIEPDSLLMPSYLNHAHNDWLEFALEGGALGLVILAAFIVWLALRLASMWRQTSIALQLQAVACAGIALAFAAGSVVDYPLRVPAGMALFACVVGLVSASQSQNRPHPSFDS